MDEQVFLAYVNKKVTLDSVAASFGITNKEARTCVVRFHATRNYGATKSCPSCKSDLERERFSDKLRNTDGKFEVCKNCHSKQNRQKHKENYTPGASRWAVIWSKYKLTEVMFNLILESQGGLCPICGEASTDWHVDHNHACCKGAVTCGKCIRGILCGPCNRGLGCFKDSRATIKRAEEYLSQFERGT